MARQDQKRGLESVFGIFAYAKYAAADVPHHRPVPFYDGCESGFVALDDEEIQKLRIGQAYPVLAERGNA